MSVADAFYRKRSSNLHGRKIIILDDIPAIADLFRRALELSGLEVTFVANSGEDLLDRLLKSDAKKVDFALVDYNLKEGRMNGLQVALAILKKNPGIKVIMVSADDSIANGAASFGFHFLKKPVALSELLEALE